MLAFTRMTGDLVKAMLGCGKPIIAAVDGVAVGDGVRQGHIVENLYREIRALRIYEGASEVQKVIIARQALSGG
jgi:alkylation response protein AidB-like acyl-CoA dehydrogenase